MYMTNLLDLPEDVLYLIDKQIEERKREKDNIFKDVDDRFRHMLSTGNFNITNINKLVANMLLYDVLTIEEFQEYTESRAQILNDLK